MPVGDQSSSTTIDSQITSLSLALRNLAQNITNLNIFINGQGEGQATLETLGYDSADATTALQAISYLYTIAGVYFGTIQAGGTGGTDAIDFDYNSALAPYWAAQ